jgi:hypothetical protein
MVRGSTSNCVNISAVFIGIIYKFQEIFNTPLEFNYIVIFRNGIESFGNKQTLLIKMPVQKFYEQVFIIGKKILFFKIFSY